MLMFPLYRCGCRQVLATQGICDKLLVAESRCILDGNFNRQPKLHATSKNHHKIN